MNTSVRRFACAQKCQLPVEVAHHSHDDRYRFAKTLPDQRQSALQVAFAKRGLPVLLVSAGSPHVDFSTMSFAVEQNRTDVIRARGAGACPRSSMYSCFATFVISAE